MPQISYKKIFRFWVPLAATWLMMSLEGPFLAAVIARLAQPKYNLAAYGIAFSFALIVEAPIIMILSASVALVAGNDSLCKLRRFTYALNSIITAGMVVCLIPPVFYFIAQDLIGLPRDIVRVTYVTCFILLPWPSAIGTIAATSITVVIRMGRSRARFASRIASSRGRPCARSWLE